jgi:hypothetical protein
MKKALTSQDLYKVLGTQPAGALIVFADGSKVDKIEAEGYSVDYPNGRVIFTLKPPVKPPAPPPSKRVVYDGNEALD